MSSRQQVGANITALMLGLLVLGSVVCIGLSALAGYSVVLDDEGLVVRNLQAEAQATRAVMAATDESAARALRLDTEQRAQAGAVLGWALAYTGIGVGVLVLIVGCAFALVAWANKHALAVYPNSAGQYPIIVRRGLGWVVMHDPNRGLGPTAVYRTPTPVDVLAGVIRLIRSPLASSPVLPDPTAYFPRTADSATMSQIAGQAQGVALMAAATRPQGIVGGDRRKAEDAIKLAQSVAEVGGGEMRQRMPRITIVDDPAKIADLRHQLLEAEGL